MRKVIIYTFLAVFLALGCGEEEDLSDQIVGSWQCQEKDMTPTLVYPFGSDMLIGRTGWTLTFYRSGRFDSIIEMMLSMEGQPEQINIKFVTEGRYEAFQDQIVLRPETSNVYTSEYDLKPFLDYSIGPEIEKAQNRMTGTSSASVTGDTLLLDGNRWTRT